MNHTGVRSTGPRRHARRNRSLGDALTPSGYGPRVALRGRGLAVEPEIILGDEPTSALDPQSSQNVERRLMELKKAYTVVVVTHILRQARRIADHLAFLYLGELVESGPAAEVFAHPRDPRTRAYLTGEIS